MGKELSADGISVTHLDMTRGVPDPRGVIRLVRFLRDEQPDVLNSFLVHANIVARISGVFSGVPAIVTSIRNDDYCEGIECIGHRLTNFMDNAWMANSGIVAERMVKRGIGSENKKNVIYNCIDLGQYKPDEEARRKLRQKLNISNDTFLWVTVGRIEPQKDYPTLLRALSKIPQGYSVKVLVAGKGSRADNVTALRTQLDLSDRISFLGVRRDVPNLLAASDGFVLSSVSEGFPNVVMEALASGTPVVATNVGGVPELVEEEETGFLVSPSDPTGLAQAMIRLMQTPQEKREMMGARGREWVAENCDVERVVDQWVNLYREALS
jgi:glycosyltransferase involved in cell wall biosynthesis